MPGFACGIFKKSNFGRKKFRFLKKKIEVFLAYVTPGVLNGSLQKCIDN